MARRAGARPSDARPAQYGDAESFEKPAKAFDGRADEPKREFKKKD